MLRKFSVENYRNFNERVTLDLTRTHNYEFSGKCISNGLLNKMILVGNNASGKTNLAYALFDIVCTLTDNNCREEQKDEDSFINASNGSGVAIFTYEFQKGDSVIVYQYGKKSPSTFAFEKFAVDGVTVFDFDYTTGRIDRSGLATIKAEKLNIEGLNGSISALRVIANNTIQADGSPVMFVIDFVNKMLYFRSCQDGNTFIGLKKNFENLDHYIVENGLVGDFQTFINDMAGLELELSAFTGPTKSRIMQKFPRKSILLEQISSSGTKALELYYYWSRRTDKISFLYIDEFDAYYHFKLAENILRYTIDNVTAQTVMTSHNTSLTSNDLLRPDCCLELKNGRIKSFADSTDRELRWGHNMEKMYRNGAFNERTQCALYRRRV